jgi:hypothetical protein
MEVSKAHKENKGESYWGDLSVGSTTAYKTLKIEELLLNFFPSRCESILDIGSGGNCDHILKYRDLLKARRIACLDYDEKIIDKMKERFPNEEIEWHVADIFELQLFKGAFDLIFLLDMLHEVYSFYGRPSQDTNKPVNHERGLEAVVKAITKISNITNQKGGIIITDDILPDEDTFVTFRTRSQEVTDAIDHFFRNYPTRKMDGVSIKNGLVTISAQDFSVLLTQYNKIKNRDWSRWNIERMEQHQYMTREQYEEIFARLGFETHMIIETPTYVKEEWERDFEIISGLKDFPKKRVTLLAMKEEV